MPAFIDLTGKRFGYLVVQSIHAPKVGPHHRWLCICDCGNTVVVLGPSLREGRTKSCGCFHIERISKHGGLNSPEYSSWTAMKNRCLNQNHASYHRYGGRGITICDRWMHSFANFLADMKAKPSPSHTLERINVNGNYEPTNCRWATMFEQRYNKVNTYRLEYEGTIWTTKELADHLGVELELFKGRVKRGNPISFSVDNPLPVRRSTRSSRKP